MCAEKFRSTFLDEKETEIKPDKLCWISRATLERNKLSAWKSRFFFQTVRRMVAVVELKNKTSELARLVWEHKPMLTQVWINGQFDGFASKNLDF